MMDESWRDDGTTHSRALQTPVEVSSRRSLALTVAAHPDLTRIGERFEAVALGAGRPLELSRHMPAFAHLDGKPRALAVRWLSRSPVQLSPGTAPGSVCLSRRGSPITLEVDGEPIADEIELSFECLRRGTVLLLASRIVLVLHHLYLLPAPRVPHFGMVGESCGMLSLRRDLERIAPLAVPVLVRGATGTGKELVARALHEASARRNGPYVALNMAAIPPSLAAAELFGASKGAFTGAQAQPGYFRRAHGGTLFLDEIGETPLEVQVLLLRALETGEVQPVGGGHPVPVDVRLVAATDADLETAIEEARFRAPLLHRLDGFRLDIPPLDQRREDIPRLLIHFLRHELERLGAVHRLAPAEDSTEPADSWLPAPFIADIVRRSWPGNVRQLRNFARQLAITNHDRETVDAASLARLLGREELPSSPAPAAAAPKAKRRPAEITDEELVATLQTHRFNLRAVAKKLGISRTSLYARIDACPALRKANDLDWDEIEPVVRATSGDLDEAAARLGISSLGLKRRIQELRRG